MLSWSLQLRLLYMQLALFKCVGLVSSALFQAKLFMDSKHVFGVCKEQWRAERSINICYFQKFPVVNFETRHVLFSRWWLLCRWAIMNLVCDNLLSLLPQFIYGMCKVCMISRMGNNWSSVSEAKVTGSI